MNQTPDCVIRELSPELLPDYLAFFDHDAFADNPRWAFCYCYFHHAPHRLQRWNDRTAAENRAAVSQLIADRQMSGYLAYLDDRVVGWCNAMPRANMTTRDPDNDPQAGNIGAIACFVIAKPYRGRGIARRLLNAACDGFQRQGLVIAEAYPLRNARSEAANHQGPLSMFLTAGFEPFKEKDGVVTVRKQLIQATR
jgi:GNAT superfamily N-acetyltransferase